MHLFCCTVTHSVSYHSVVCIVPSEVHIICTHDTGVWWKKPERIFAKYLAELWIKQNSFCTESSIEQWTWNSLILTYFALCVGTVYYACMLKLRHSLSIWWGGSINGKALDSIISKNPRFEPRQDHKNKLWEFFWVKMLCWFVGVPNPSVYTHCLLEAYCPVNCTGSPQGIKNDHVCRMHDQDPVVHVTLYCQTCQSLVDCGNTKRPSIHL